MLNQGSRHGAEKEVFLPQFEAMAHGASNDTPQDITTAFVGWQHTVCDQESTGANMVSDNIQRFVALVGGIGQLCGRTDQSLKKICVVIAVNTL